MSERRPRVAIFTPDFPPAHGGIQHLVYRLAQHYGTSVEAIQKAKPGRWSKVYEADWGRTRSSWTSTTSRWVAIFVPF